MTLLELAGGDEPIRFVTIDNPPANTLRPELYVELTSLVAQLEDDHACRVVVFRSANEKIFASGADLKRLTSESFTRGRVSERIDRANDALLRLQRLGKPTIAVVEGHALGGGLELALAMDFRVMQRGRARVGLPEASLGLIPAAGGTQRLTRLVGRTRATELMMLARRLDADEAAAIGLVTEAADDAMASAKALADQLAAMPASSLRSIKQCLNDGVDAGLAAGLAIERRAAVDAFGDPEAQRRIEAFLNRGRPEGVT